MKKYFVSRIYKIFEVLSNFLKYLEAGGRNHGVTNMPMMYILLRKRGPQKRPCNLLLCFDTHPNLTLHPSTESSE